jgi:anti-sigma B factor antagonist
MSGVEWIDSTGLGTLVGALKRAREKHGTVQVAGAPDRIAKHFQITGLSRLFGMHATVDDALAITAEAEVTP